MSKIALTIPGPGGSLNISNPPGLVFGANGDPVTIGSILSAALNLTFLIAGILMVIWLFWGIFEYIFAGGDKNGLAAAQKRMMWAIIGFIILLFAFPLSQYVQNIYVRP